MARFSKTFLRALLVIDVCISIIRASRSGCSNPLGMQNGAISNSQLRCSSYYENNKDWDASQARLYWDKAWCSHKKDIQNEFLEIDLLRVRHVSALATQGYRGGLPLRRSYYVKTFMIKYSYDGASWYIYEASNGADVTFTGNSNAVSVKKNYFRDTFITRFIRIYPKEFNRDMCLRVELYGCSDQADDCSRYITSATGFINSPGYPDSYPSNKDCTWLISVSSGKNITLMFTHFDIYQGSNPRSCSDDFVEVTNGLTDISRHIGSKYCNGNRLMLITTSRNIVRIHFQSGSASLSHKGFQIEYVSVTPGLDDVLAVKACDNDTLALNCSSYDYTITILHAWYQLGSFPHSCGQHHNTMTSSCAAVDAKSIVISKCQDYKECSISVSKSLFGDCASGAARHQLEVFYQCTSRNIKTPAPTLTLPPTQTSTKAPSTTPPITTNRQPSHSFTGNTSGNSTLIPSIVTMPNTTPSPVFSVGTDVPSPTERTSSRSAPPPVGGKEAQTGRGMASGTMAAVIVVVIAVIITALLIVLYLFRKKRKKKAKGDVFETVEFTSEREYSTPDNSARRRCPLDYSGSSNAYQTVNILYQSGDNSTEPNSSRSPDVSAYASCSVSASLPKVTENPLYKEVAPPFTSAKADEEYELVKSPPPGYESPSDSPLPKIKSIQNPNYEKTLPLTTHEYDVPVVSNC